jgi:hypothetical protein
MQPSVEYEEIDLVIGLGADDILGQFHDRAFAASPRSEQRDEPNIMIVE